MNKANELIVTKTEVLVKDKLSGESSGHDWWHVFRVHNLAKRIAIEEGANTFIVSMAALLHDIPDYKLNGGDEKIGFKLINKWMDELNVAHEDAQHIIEIIKGLSFKGAKVKSEMSTLEGKIVQDADRLDAIGAIGIGRTFAYGGHKGRELFNPAINPELHDEFEKYKNNKSPTINHFYEKLLLLKDLMNTDFAKKIAFERHQFMVDFLENFFAEWNGEK